jgi:diacylglycerol kinase
MNRFFRSFEFAFRGIISSLSRENNCRIQLVLGGLALAAGAWLGLDRMEWIAVVLCIALVIGMEMINSAIEKTCDRITRERDDYVRYIKDVAAGAVLWTSLGAAAVGAIIFLPKIIKLFV